MSQIDTLDEQILAALQANGRLTMKALAEQVGLSSPAMIERVRRLEERGVIDGYRANVSPAALGRPLTALVAAEVERGRADAFLNKVQNDPAVAECHRTTGVAGYLVKAHVADTTALEQLVDGLTNAGAQCATTLILSSPVAYRPVTAPAGTAGPRTRLRRRRTTKAMRTGAMEAAAASDGAAPRRRGRPPGRRTGTKAETG